MGSDIVDVDVLLPVRDPNVFWLQQTVLSLEKQENVKCRLVVVLHPDNCHLEDMLAAAIVPTKIVSAPADGNLSDALNTGLRACEAPFVARIDQDDIAEPRRLQRQLEELTSDPSCIVIGSDAYLINSDGAIVGLRRLPTTARGILRRTRWRPAVMHPTVMFRRDVIRELGGYSSAAANVEDFDLWLRVLTRGSIRSIGQPLLRYRLHDAQMTQTKAIAAEAAAAVLTSRVSLARSRQESVIMARLRHKAWLTRQQLRRS